MKRFYAGLDIHKETLYGTVLDEHGTTLEEGSIPYNRQALQNFFGWIPSPHLEIAIEACGLWRGAHKLLTQQGYKVVLANPLKTHQIASNKKTDQVDSKILADLLRTGYLPTVYIPSEDTLKLRDIARHRARLVRLRASLKVRIKASLNQNGTPYTAGWNKNSMEYLKTINPEIASFVRIIEATNQEIKLVTREVNAIATNRHLTTILQTAPGIGSFSSLMILAEIADVKRFPHPKKLVSYGGLCPGIHQSGNTQYSVPNRACNKWLKWIITECSGRAILLDKRYGRHYYELKRRKGFRTARRSVARMMLTDVWHMLTNEEPYRAS